MRKLLLIILWFAVGYCQATPQSAVVPDWLAEVALHKQQAPEQMLQLLQAHQGEFSALSPEMQAYWLTQQAGLLSYLGRYQEQQQSAQDGLALLQNQRSEIKVELLYELGYAREMQLALSEALQWYQQGTDLAAQLEHKKLQVRGIINIAAIDSLQGRDPEALQKLKEAYASAQQLQDKELLADANAQLGLMYSSLAFEQEAQEFLEQALVLYQDLGWQKSRISVLYNLARNYSYLKHYEQALQRFEQMLQLAQQVQDSQNLYYAYSGLAITSNEMGRSQLALNYMQKAEEYLPKLQSGYDLVGHYYEKALIYKKLQQNSQGIQQLLLAEQYFQQLSDSEAGNMRLAFSFLKAELLAAQGQYERAYRQLFEFVLGFQASRDQENEQALATTRMAFETEREAVRLNHQAQESQLTSLRQTDSDQTTLIQLLWLGLAFALALLLLTIIMLLRVRKRYLAASAALLQQENA